MRAELLTELWGEPLPQSQQVGNTDEVPLHLLAYVLLICIPLYGHFSAALSLSLSLNAPWLNHYTHKRFQAFSYLCLLV